MSNFVRYSSTEFPRQQYSLVNSIPKDIIPLLIQHNILIAGGSITSVFTNSEIKDLDLYPTSYDGYVKFDKELANLVSKSSNTSDKLLFISENAKTYRYHNTIIQIIQKFVVNLDDAENSTLCPEQVLSTFDFTCCMGCYSLSQNEFTLHKNFLVDNAGRNLVYNSENPRYPICAMYRVLKYEKKGYHISAGELVKLALCICNLKMESYKDLKDQLLGIDTQIFQELTDDLIGKNGRDCKIDYGVVMSLINDKLNSLWYSE